MESVGGSFWTGAGWALRRGSPPGPGRGIQAFSRESPDAKSRGGGPPPPLVLGAARSHSLVLAWWGAAGRWLGYFDTHVCALIWNLSFAKCFFSIFFQKNASQIGLSIPEGIAPRTDQRERSPKRASDSKRAIKPGSRGRAPALFLPISREKWGPPPGRRGPRGAAPRGLGKAPTTQRVRSTVPLPRPGPGGNPPRRCQPAPVQTGPPAVPAETAPPTEAAPAPGGASSPPAG